RGRHLARDGVADVPQVVLVPLFDVGQQQRAPRRPAVQRLRVIADERRGQCPLGGVKVVGGETDLLEVVGAVDAGGGVADFLGGGQQQADEDGDDGDHHQQLDQREPLAGRRAEHDAAPVYAVG